MIVPEEIVDLTRCFQLDTITQPFSEPAWIDSQVKQLGEAKRRKIRVFLDQLLAKKMSNQELRKIWDLGDPDFYFGNDEELRLFLGMVRERL